ALVPVRLGEGAEGVDLLVEPVEDAAVPAARLALGGDALDGVPAPPVGLPGHGRVLADLLQLDVALLLLLCGEGVEARPLLVRSPRPPFPRVSPRWAPPPGGPPRPPASPRRRRGRRPRPPPARGR